MARVEGVDPTEVPPDIKLADESRPIPEPYVCIGVQSTTQAKYWNNPMGWHEIVRFLKEPARYRLIGRGLARPPRGWAGSQAYRGVGEAAGRSRPSASPSGCSDPSVPWRSG